MFQHATLFFYLWMWLFHKLCPTEEGKYKKKLHHYFPNSIPETIPLWNRINEKQLYDILHQALHAARIKWDSRRKYIMWQGWNGRICSSLYKAHSESCRMLIHTTLHLTWTIASWLTMCVKMNVRGNVR